MALVIEATDESGPCGLPAISICHYGEQNGDLMRDPEMCFELGLANGPHLNAFYYRNDYVGRRAVEPHHRSRQLRFISSALHQQHESDSPRCGITTCDCRASAEAFEQQQTPRA